MTCNDTALQYQADFIPSVVIVGAGATGLTAANLLGMAGIKTLVLERNEGIYEFPRAIAIDDEGLRVCQAMGLADEILAHIRLNVKADYISRERFFMRVAPSTKRNGYPLLSTFHQPTFERILLHGIERFSCVKVLFQHTLEAFEQDEEKVCISVRTPGASLVKITCDYLLACDGGKSATRRALAIAIRPPVRFSRMGKTKNGLSSPGTGQKWLVVDCIADTEPADTIIFLCNVARPTVCVPGPGKQRRWEFMLLAGEREGDLSGEDTIHALIQNAQQSIPARQYVTDAQSVPTVQIIRQAIYTFHALTATSFSKGRVFLLGDAAHLMPPFGGQGMNSGLRDAYNLCWKLQLLLQKQSKPELLASYHVERHAHVEQMILFSWLLGKVVMPTDHLTAFLRDIFFHSIDKVPFMREAIKELRVKPQARYRRGSLLVQSGGEASKLVGRLLPQPYVLTQEAKRVLLDDVLGNSFALLRLGEDPTAAFAGLRHEVWSRLGVRFVGVQPAGIEEQWKLDGWVGVVDIEGELGAFLGSRRGLFVLVRPDKYVMGVFRSEEADRFVGGIERCLMG